MLPARTVVYLPQKTSTENRQFRVAAIILVWAPLHVSKTSVALDGIVSPPFKVQTFEDTRTKLLFLRTSTRESNNLVGARQNPAQCPYYAVLYNIIHAKTRTATRFGVQFESDFSCSNLLALPGEIPSK